MSGNSNQSSTLSAMFQGVTGTLQSSLGQLAGNNTDIQEGDSKKTAAMENDKKSHTAAKLGPVTATAEGGTHVDSKDRQQGAWDQTIGSGKEFVGGLVGNESLKTQGRTQYDEGVRREASGQANDLVEGMGNRVAGSLGALISTDEQDQERFNRQHDEGKAAIRSVQYDLQRKAEADGGSI